MVFTFTNTGHKVEVSSSGLIDHLKCRALVQHCNALIQPVSYFCSTYSSLKPPSTSPQGCLESESSETQPERHQQSILSNTHDLSFRLTHHSFSHIPLCPPAPLFDGCQVTTVLFPMLSILSSLFQACFTFPLILLSVHPSVFPLSSSCSVPYSSPPPPPPPPRSCAHCFLQAEKQMVCASTQRPKEWTRARAEKQNE